MIYCFFYFIIKYKQSCSNLHKAVLNNSLSLHLN